MRALIQRVSRGSVTVEGQVVGAIGRGLVILLGVRAGDTLAEVDWVAQKCIGLRIFEDEEGKFNRSIQEVAGSVLVVSQFTLYADTRRGRRPGLTDAARPEEAEPLVQRFIERLRDAGLPVETGVFGAHMLVEILNDGPVTVLVEREAT